MEIVKKENKFNNENTKKKKISPFLNKLFTILEVSYLLILQIYRMRKIKILLDGIKKGMASLLLITKDL